MPMIRASKKPTMMSERLQLSPTYQSIVILLVHSQPLDHQS